MRRWHIKAADLNSVLFRNVAHVGVFACDAHEGFAGVAVLVDVSDVAGREVGGEGDVDCVLRVVLVDVVIEMMGKIDESSGE